MLMDLCWLNGHLVMLRANILPTSTDVDQTEPAVPNGPQADSNTPSAGLALRGSTTAPFVADSTAAEVTHHSDGSTLP